MIRLSHVLLVAILATMGIYVTAVELMKVKYSPTFESIGGFSGVLGVLHHSSHACLLSLQRLKEVQPLIQNSTSPNELVEVLCKTQPQVVSRDTLDFWSVPLENKNAPYLKKQLEMLKIEQDKGAKDSRLIENTVALLPFLGQSNEVARLSFLCTYYSINNVFQHVVVTVRSAEDQNFVESLRLPNAFKVIDVYTEVKSSKPPSEEGFLKNSVMTLASRFLNPGAKLFHDFQYIYYAGASHHVMHLRTGKPSGVSGGAGGTDDGPGGGGGAGLPVEEQLLDLIDDSGGTITLAPHVHAERGGTGSCCYAAGKSCEASTQRVQCSLPEGCSVRMPRRGEETCRM